MAKAWNLIFVGEGGSLRPLAWALLTDSIAAWLSQRMMDAADFMRFICFAFSVLEFAFFLFVSHPHNGDSRRLPSVRLDGEFGHSSRALSQNNQQ
jgi:hypothetical protein